MPTRGGSHHKPGVESGLMSSMGVCNCAWATTFGDSSHLDVCSGKAEVEAS